MNKLKINKKTGLRMFDIGDVRSWGPCYAPERHLKANMRYSAVSILLNKKIPIEDRLWVVLRPELCSDKLMRLFAVWCARQVQHLMKDERSLQALDVEERFAHGLVTIIELDAAMSGASAAARYAARGAARDAQINKLIGMLLAEGAERLIVRTKQG